MSSSCDKVNALGEAEGRSCISSNVWDGVDVLGEPVKFSSSLGEGVGAALLSL